MTDEQLIAALTRHLTTQGEAPDLGFPYDDLVAGLVGGTLLDDERAHALQTLEGHAGFRALVAEVAETEVVSADATPPHPDTDAVLRRTASWKPLATAAAALLAIGAGLLLMRGSGEPNTPEARWAQHVASLAEAHAETFGEFRIDTVQDATPKSRDVRRGSLDLVGPRGGMLESRPVFRWEPLEGDASYDLSVISEMGETVYAETDVGTPHVWGSEKPELEPGRYVWRVIAHGEGRRVTATMAFRRLSEAEVKKYKAGIERIRAAGGPFEEATVGAWDAWCGVGTE